MLCEWFLWLSAIFYKQVKKIAKIKFCSILCRQQSGNPILFLFTSTKKKRVSRLFHKTVFKIFGFWENSLPALFFLMIPKIFLCRPLTFARSNRFILEGKFLTFRLQNQENCPRRYRRT